MSTPGAPSGSSPNRHATALLVHTLTFATGEDVPAWLRRNGLTDAARSGLVLERVTDFGMPFADRHDRFNGVTIALLDIVLPLGMNLPFADGLEFAPSQSRIAPGVFFQQRYIQAWETRLHFTTELPLARAEWPLPLTRVLACLAPEQHNAVLGALRTAVDLKCAAPSGRSLDEQSLKHHLRTWRKLQGPGHQFAEPARRPPSLHGHCPIALGQPLRVGPRGHLQDGHGPVGLVGRLLRGDWYLGSPPRAASSPCTVDSHGAPRGEGQTDGNSLVSEGGASQPHAARPCFTQDGRRLLA